MMGNWEYLKHKQIYFVEFEGQTLKFKGFDNLDNWIKKRSEGEEWVLYCVATVMKMSRRPLPKNDRKES